MRSEGRVDIALDEGCLAHALGAEDDDFGFERGHDEGLMLCVACHTNEDFVGAVRLCGEGSVVADARCLISH